MAGINRSALGPEGGTLDGVVGVAATEDEAAEAGTDLVLFRLGTGPPGANALAVSVIGGLASVDGDGASCIAGTGVLLLLTGLLEAFSPTGSSDVGLGTFVVPPGALGPGGAGRCCWPGGPIGTCVGGNCIGAWGKLCWGGNHPGGAP